MNIINECYEKSIALLINNSTLYGIMASSRNSKAESRDYTSIFGRDASICALGMAASENKKLIRTAEKSLINLADYQAMNGQIPNFVKPEIGKSDFWYLGCIDATLWWLIAVKYFDKYAKPACRTSRLEKPLGKRLSKNIASAINWLEAQEHPLTMLLAQNEASDWADIMPRSGFVLYTNSLWYLVKKLYSLNNAKETRNSFNYLFNPWQKFSKKLASNSFRCKKMMNFIKAKGKRQNYYLSFINFFFAGEDADVYANSLTMLAGLSSSKKTDKIINDFIKMKRKKLLPMPVLFKPIEENSKMWRDYMKSFKQDYPYQYHNGGIWPFASSFWAMALLRAGRKKEAEEELARIALANSKNNWQFNEWFSPKTGQPMGMAGQSWNAGMFIFAFEYLRGKIKF